MYLAHYIYKEYSCSWAYWAPSGYVGLFYRCTWHVISVYTGATKPHGSTEHFCPWAYWALCGYVGLFCRDSWLLLWIFGVLLRRHLALLRICRAILRICRALLRRYWAHHVICRRSNGLRRRGTLFWWIYIRFFGCYVEIFCENMGLFGRDVWRIISFRRRRTALRECGTFLFVGI